MTPQGEFVSIPDRLVCSPAWGRLRSERVEEGRAIEPGMVIGTVGQGGAEVPLVSMVAGRFVEWLAGEGERAWPGMPLARLCVE